MERLDCGGINSGAPDSLAHLARLDVAAAGSWLAAPEGEEAFGRGLPDEGRGDEEKGQEEGQEDAPRQVVAAFGAHLPNGISIAFWLQLALYL